jgi:hypothetical protein
MNVSRQEQINKVMCKPGYQWNETLGKCLGMGGGAAIDDSPASPPKLAPNDAIAMERASRENTGEVL